ncbi:MAG TPA: fluoride efflux transporter CrcB [Terriglobales bacterium]|nr:fluoride efflux transporter CrcB [Terriglobales bacterium]
MLDFLAISLGAVLGANLRYWMSRCMVRWLGPVFPYSTLAINVIGSFVLGFFLVWTIERTFVDPRWRLLIAVGFCGGFTTFSSYAYETVVFFEQGHWSLMAVNFMANNLLACLAVLSGMALARVL